MINLNGIRVKNRFFVSAGALSYGEGYFWQKPLMKLKIIDPAIFGGVATRTLLEEPQRGNFIEPFSPPSFFEKLRYYFEMIRARDAVLQKIPSGFINNFSWWNVGIDYYIKEIYPETEGVSRIVSVGGFVIDDYIKVIQKLNDLDIIAAEINISCPNIGYSLASDSSELVKLLAFCRESSRHPLILKIGPEGDYLKIARIAEYCRINALAVSNTMPGLKINKEKIFKGGISGPSLKPIALRMITDLRAEGIKLPIIGGGGIESWQDCKDYFSVGADAVSFGSVFMRWNKFWLPTFIARKYKNYNWQ